MAWKPKTVAGKILKGAMIGAGSVLSLAAGVGVVGGIIKGTGAIAGAVSGLKGTKTVLDKVGASAVNLVTGTTAEQRQILQDYRKEVKTEAQKLEFADKLISLGMSQEEARAKAGLTAAETVKGVKDVEPATLLSSKNLPMLLLAGAAILFLLFKKR